MSIWESREEIVEQLAENKAALKRSLDPNYTADGDSVEQIDLDIVRRNIQYLKGELDAWDGKAGPVVVQGMVRR